MEQSHHAAITTTTAPNGPLANPEPQFGPQPLAEAAQDRGPGGSPIGDLGGATSIGSGAEDSARQRDRIFPARNISDASSSEIECKGGPPLRHDPALDEFDREVGEAARLQQEIVEIEAKIDEGTEDANRRLAPLRTAQALSSFRVCKLVHDGKVPSEAVDEFVRKGGGKPHANESIPHSRLIRAIVAQGTVKGTPNYKRMRQRATTYASAIDHALRVGMTEDEFRAEIEGLPKKAGKYHGIEHLAAEGRVARDAGKPLPTPPAMPYTVSGDFAGIKPGDHLLLITVAEGAAEMAGALLVVDEKMIRRVLTADEKARSKAK